MKKPHLVATLLWMAASPVLAGNDKPEKIPDFLQTDPDGKLPGDGSEYCAPVSVSNSLMWLATQGFPALKPQGGEDKKAQIALIHTLGELMKTDAEIGTNVPKIMTGIDAYFQKAKYQYAKLEYQGWRPTGKWSAAKEVPDIASLAQIMAEPLGLAWLNIGWYLPNAKKKEYERNGGHWVTLVGVSGNKLLIHDPSPRAGKDFATDEIDLEVIREGMLVGKDKNLPHKADGYFQIKGKTFSPEAIKKKVAILDGFIVFLPKKA